MNYEFAPQSYTEFFSFVIQSVAKDLVDMHVRLIEVRDYSKIKTLCYSV